jgi:hypothetical protein
VHQPHSLLTLFLNRLQEALTQYTQLDPTSPAGAPILAGHFISQSAPDIRTKLKKAKNGPQTPIQNLIKMAFKVLMPKRDNKINPPKNTSNKRWPSKPKPWWQPCGRLDYSPESKEEPETSHQPLWGPASDVAKKSHWARQCPNPRPPTKPYPKYKQVGHWGSDCLGQGLPPTAPRGGSAPPAIQIPDFLGLAED